MNYNQLLRQVAREIRYLSIPNLIGREVEIRSFDTIVTDIFKDLCNLLPDKYKQVGPVHPLAIAKYGILDLEFQVPTASLKTGNYQSGISLLKEFGFIESKEERQRAQDTAESFGDKLTDDPFCLTELAEDIEKKQVFLKLFLESESVVENYDLDQMPIEETIEFFNNLSLPTDYFPRKFLITDACLTNAGFVWINKHFYL